MDKTKTKLMSEKTKKAIDLIKVWYKLCFLFYLHFFQQHLVYFTLGDFCQFLKYSV